MRRFSIIGIAVAALALTAVRPCGASAGGSIVPVSPHPSERVSTTTPAIVVQVNGVGTLDGAVHFTIDGRDVSDGLTISGNHVSYKPAHALAGGLHAVQVDVDDAGGSRLSYQWSFTVDGPVATQSTDQKAAPAAGDAGASGPSAAPPLQPASDGSDIPSYPPLNAALGDSGPPFGYPNFGLYALTPPPYYWGQNVPFVFNGIGGGNGFVTFGGAPGLLNLMPLGVNTYYVVVPIPVGFQNSNPPVVCHFFTPNGTPATVPYHRQVAIIGHRQPAVVRVARTGSVSRSLATRSPTTRAYASFRTVPGTRSFATLRPTTPAMRPAVHNAIYLPSRAARPMISPIGYGSRQMAMPVTSRAGMTVR